MPSWREAASEREAARRTAIDDDEVRTHPQTAGHQSDVANELGLGDGEQRDDQERRQPLGRSPFRIRDDDDQRK